jgi:hypothetical protein
VEVFKSVVAVVMMCFSPVDRIIPSLMTDVFMAVGIVDVMQVEPEEDKKVDNSKNEIFFRLH